MSIKGNSKGELKEKITKVSIVRSSKLTLTEINALTEKIISNTNKKIKLHNSEIVSNTEYKKELKKIKTSTGVLSAERALTFIKTNHKKVQIVVISQECNEKISKLYNSFVRKELNDWENSIDFRNIKNELILSQVNNKNMFEIADIIEARLTTNS